MTAMHGIDYSEYNDDESDDESIDPTVDCDQCEAACCRLTVMLMPDDRSVPPWLVTYDDAGHPVLAKGEDGWCAAIDPLTFRCTIYDQRPQLCRKYCMGGPACRYEREKWYGKPGIGTPIVLITGK
jgi:uncharacterized protein